MLTTAIGEHLPSAVAVRCLVATDRATQDRAPVKTFMADHNAVIMMVILLILGAKLIGSGLADVSD